MREGNKCPKVPDDCRKKIGYVPRNHVFLRTTPLHKMRNQTQVLALVRGSEESRQTCFDPKF